LPAAGTLNNNVPLLLFVVPFFVDAVIAGLFVVLLFVRAVVGASGD
jgi:hypothetical protein